MDVITRSRFFSGYSMDGFKDAVQKLEQLRDGGFIAPEEFEKSKKELVYFFSDFFPSRCRLCGLRAYSG